MSPRRNNSTSINTLLGVIIVIAIICGGWYLCSAHSDHNSDDSRISEPVLSAKHIPELEKTLGAPITSRSKNYNGFTVAFNPSQGVPYWVGWELTRSETAGTQARSNKFWQDTDLPGCPKSSDYRNSGFDRGHMFPAADAKFSKESMIDCFSMANICPQSHALNGGAWKTLEEKCRQWAQRDSALVIVAGPICTATDVEYIGTENKVRVPAAFYKVILAPYTNPPRAIGFIYPNDHAPGNMQNYSMPVDEVEKATGFDFFSNLPDSIENIVESKTSFKEWNNPRH